MKSKIGILSLSDEVKKLCVADLFFDFRFFSSFFDVLSYLKQDDFDVLVIDVFFLQKIEIKHFELLVSQKFKVLFLCEEGTAKLSPFIDLREGRFYKLRYPCDFYTFTSTIRQLVYGDDFELFDLAETKGFYTTHKNYFENQLPSIQNKIEEYFYLANQRNPLLILGKSGSGKTFLAKFLHDISMLWSESFLTVNCAAIPENLAESELFGTVKGAYTGAENRDGYFDVCKDGTLFLDEIGDLSLAIQGKILQVLDSGEFFRVGSSEVRKSKVRLIFATNKNLEKLVEEKKFRFDLYQRIMAFKIVMQPLKERKDDILFLTDTFLKGSGKRLSLAAENFLMEYSWPGNIRELKMCLERAKVFCHDDIIKREHLFCE